MGGTLGIDSAFSIVEAVQATINDNKPVSWRKSWTLPVVCLIGAVFDNYRAHNVPPELNKMFLFSEWNFSNYKEICYRG